MPHKVNPIDFENGEGNLGYGQRRCWNTWRQVPVSPPGTRTDRFHRSAQPGHRLWLLFAGLQSILRALTGSQPNEQRLAEEPGQVLGSPGRAVQTVMRLHGVPEPYEKLKALTRDRHTRERLA